jgi:hypothetical protein
MPSAKRMYAKPVLQARKQEEGVVWPHIRPDHVHMPSSEGRCLAGLEAATISRHTIEFTIHAMQASSHATTYAVNKAGQRGSHEQGGVGVDAEPTGRIVVVQEGRLQGCSKAAVKPISH